MRRWLVVYILEINIMQEIKEIVSAEVVSINPNRAGDAFAISAIVEKNDKLYFVDGIWHNSASEPSYGVGSKVRLAKAKCQDDNDRWFVLAS